MLYSTFPPAVYFTRVYMPILLSQFIPPSSSSDPRILFLTTACGFTPEGSVVKNLPANAENTTDVDWILGWEDPLEKGMATHSSILAWEIPQTEETGGYSPERSQKVSHD